MIQMNDDDRAKLVRHCAEIMSITYDAAERQIQENPSATVAAVLSNLSALTGLTQEELIPQATESASAYQSRMAYILNSADFGPDLR
jgi:hypothetical protein